MIVESVCEQFETFENISDITVTINSIWNTIEIYEALLGFSAYYLTEILSEVLFKNIRDIPVRLMVDSGSLFDNVCSVGHVGERRLGIDIVSYIC